MSGHETQQPGRPDADWLTQPIQLFDNPMSPARGGDGAFGPVTQFAVGLAHGPESGRRDETG